MSRTTSDKRPRLERDTLRHSQSDPGCSEGINKSDRSKTPLPFTFQKSSTRENSSTNRGLFYTMTSAAWGHAAVHSSTCTPRVCRLAAETFAYFSLHCCWNILTPQPYALVLQQFPTQSNYSFRHIPLPAQDGIPKVPLLPIPFFP